MSTSVQNGPAQARTVMVTGASGYIAGWIIKYLLDAGHTVHATVRDPGKASSTDHLRKVAAGTPGSLKFFKADLLDAGSFDLAATGCDVVMHTASPFVLDGYTDANEALVRPAVEGTRNVLAAVQQAATVKRVVLTSSVAAIYGDHAELATIPSGMFGEDHWNTTSTVTHGPYQYSKVAAERAAWEVARSQSRWDMVSINPAMVYGPALTTSSQSGSIDTLVRMGKGKFGPALPNLAYGVVDVRDVAQAHVNAAFKPEANGRYILSAKEMTMLEIAGALRKQWPSGYRFPFMTAPKALVWVFGPLLGPVTREFISKNVNHPLRLDNSRSVRELGISYRSMDTALVEHFQQLIDSGLVPKK